MADTLYDLTPAIIPFIALLVGLFLGRLLAIRGPQGERGEKGDTGPMGVPGDPGRYESHTHRIRDIAGLTEALNPPNRERPTNGEQS